MSVSSQGQLMESTVGWVNSLLWVSKQHTLHVVRVKVCCSPGCFGCCRKVSFCFIFLSFQPCLLIVYHQMHKIAYHKAKLQIWKKMKTWAELFWILIYIETVICAILWINFPVSLTLYFPISNFLCQVNQWYLSRYGGWMEYKVKWGGSPFSVLLNSFI